jgi:hypothetical protein
VADTAAFNGSPSVVTSPPSPKSTLADIRNSGPTAWRRAYLSAEPQSPSPPVPQSPSRPHVERDAPRCRARPMPPRSA